jgi:hypothetical protein
MKLLLKVFANLIVSIVLASTQAVLADDLYRCGNTYQDTPCRGVVSKPINEKPAKKSPINNNVASANKKVVATKPATPTTADECKKRGEAAKIIAKLREIGVSADEQIAIAPDGASVSRINDIYGRSGSAFQIQNAVERECMQQQQKTSLTSKWMAQARSMLGFGAAPAPTETSVKNKAKPVRTIKPALTSTQPAQPQVRSTADPKVVNEPSQAISTPAAQPEPNTSVPAIAPSEPVAQPEPAPQASEPTPPPAPISKQTPQPEKEEAQGEAQGMCGALKAGLANIASQKRKGGDAATMKDLKDQQTELENVMKSAGC